MENPQRQTQFDVAGGTLLLLSLLLCVIGLSKFQSNTEDVLQWLPDNSPTREEYNDFERKFGADDFLLATWEGCAVNDPRLNQFCEKLARKESSDLIRSVVSGSDVLTKLRDEFDLPAKHILNRFKGIFFGVGDTRKTLALIQLTKAGSADRRGAMRQVEDAIAETDNLELEEITFGGYPYVGLSIDNSLRNSFRYFFLPSIFLAAITSISCLKNVLLSSIVFVAAIGAALCSIAIVPVLGYKFGGLMSIIPALVYILTTSGSIHLIHYSLDAIGDPRKLLAVAWKPCSISALTTAIGMLSLSRSGFPAIRSFGMFCAIGAIFALLFQLVIVPWLLYRLGQAGQRKLVERGDRHQLWERISLLIQRHRYLLAFAGLALMTCAAVGLSQLSASVQIEKLFDEKSDFIVQITSLEEHIGPIDQCELVIEFEDVTENDFHVRAQMVYLIQRYVSSLEDVSSAHSMLNYLPRIPAGKGVRSNMKRTMIRSKIDDRRSELAKTRFLDVSANAETWRISFRFPFTKEVDVQVLKETLLDRASDAVGKLMVKDEFAGITSPVSLRYTGKNYLFQSAQSSLLQDFYYNFLLAFAIITPVLIIVLRSFGLGLLAMLPNLFPIVVLFGLLGWLNWPIDLAIAMTASVALGIAVDDTTHFLIRFRAFGGTSKNIVAPVGQAISQCGPAMLHTTAIGTAGLLVYGASEMTVVSNFSFSITCMLVLAIVADILMLPALLMLGVKKSNDES